MVGENADVYSGPGMGIYPFNARISWLNASGPDASNGPRGTAWLLLGADIFDLMSVSAAQEWCREIINANNNMRSMT